MSIYIDEEKIRKKLESGKLIYWIAARDFEILFSKGKQNRIKRGIEKKYAIFYRLNQVAKKMEREELEEYLEFEIKKFQENSERLEEIFNDFMRGQEKQGENKIN